MPWSFKWTPRRLKLLLNLFAPYLGAGISVTYISPDWHEMQVQMKLRWYNRNAVGTQFGGSLYSMVDPHLMLMLMQLLGNGYVVWDKAASIEFISPGKGTVYASFKISPEILAEIRQQTANGDKYLPEFDIAVVDAKGQLVAVVHKVLYVRHKKKPEM